MLVRGYLYEVCLWSTIALTSADPPAPTCSGYRSTQILCGQTVRFMLGCTALGWRQLLPVPEGFKILTHTGTGAMWAM
jgi:hypothetical protein